MSPHLIGDDNTYPSMKWIRNYMGVAEQVSSWSKDPSTKCGAVAVGKFGQIISQGYNGFPRGVDDRPDRYADKETKYKYVVHAELNCIYNAALNGTSMNGSMLYVYGLPVCNECAKGIVQIGVSKVFMKYPTDISDKWKNAFSHTKDMFDESGIDYFIVP